MERTPRVWRFRSSTNFSQYFQELTRYKRRTVRSAFLFWNDLHWYHQYFHIVIGRKKIYIRYILHEYPMKSQEDVISVFKNRHGDRYDYSLVRYRSGKKPIEIICTEHGSFFQIPNKHRIGHGCPKCKGGNISKGKTRSREKFIELAKEVHGETYGYDKVVYEKGTKKVKIVCQPHGEFDQTPTAHLAGQGCPQCGRIRSALSRMKTQDEFINDCRRFHGTKYDYSGTVYQGDDKDVTVICPDHGEFRQKAGTHLISGCRKCSGNVLKTTEEFVRDARAIHGDRYDYSLVDYQNAKTAITIICPDHGSFIQIPKDHIIKKNGCWACGGSYPLTTEAFVESAKKKHGSRYGYDFVRYENAKSKVKITCSIHGIFVQNASSHLTGRGCPSCRISRPQIEIMEFVKNLGETVIPNERQALGNRREIDVYIPERKFGIEYHGFVFHCDRGKKEIGSSGIANDYHRKKFLLAQENQIDLIQITEDEWRDRRVQCERIIRNRLGLTPRGPGARKLDIRVIDGKLANEFLDQNHIQGKSVGKVYFGAYQGERLCGVMVMGHPYRQSRYEWELRRFAVDDRSYPGLFSRMFKWFVVRYNPRSVVSFADLRWFRGNSYQSGGFRLDGYVSQDYSYVDLHAAKPIRMNKSKFRKSRLGGTGSEQDQTQALGLVRFYDAGKARWVWKDVNTVGGDQC